MLSKKDKQFIKDTIREEFIKALTVEWRIEKVRDEKTGQPLAVKEVKTEKVFIPSVFVQMMPYLEGSLRGVQEDMAKNNNKINHMQSGFKMIGKIMMEAEESLRVLSDSANNIKLVGQKKIQEKLDKTIQML